MLGRQDILEYLRKKKFNRQLRGYTYIIDILYWTDQIGETGVSYDKAMDKAIQTVANDYSVTQRAITASIRLVFREANITKTVKNTLRGMYYDVITWK